MISNEQSKKSFDLFIAKQVNCLSLPPADPRINLIYALEEEVFKKCEEKGRISRKIEQVRYFLWKECGAYRKYQQLTQKVQSIKKIFLPEQETEHITFSGTKEMDMEKIIDHSIKIKQMKRHLLQDFHPDLNPDLVGNKNAEKIFDLLLQDDPSSPENNIEEAAVLAQYYFPEKNTATLNLKNESEVEERIQILNKILNKHENELNILKDEEEYMFIDRISSKAGREAILSQAEVVYETKVEIFLEEQSGTI